MQRCLQWYLTSITDDGNEETMTSVEVSDWCKTIPVCQVIWQYINEWNKLVDMSEDYNAKYEEHFSECTLCLSTMLRVPKARRLTTIRWICQIWRAATRRQAQSGTLDVSLCAVHNKSMGLLHFMIATLTPCLHKLVFLDWSTLCPHKMAEGSHQKDWIFILNQCSIALNYYTHNQKEKVVDISI